MVRGPEIHCIYSRHILLIYCLLKSKTDFMCVVGRSWDGELGIFINGHGLLVTL